MSYKWKFGFRQKIGNLKVTVSVTPTGYADSAVFNPESDVGDSVKFLMPHEEEMTVNNFLDIIEDPGSHPGVHYIQKQERNTMPTLCLVNLYKRDFPQFKWRAILSMNPLNLTLLWLWRDLQTTLSKKDFKNNIRGRLLMTPHNFMIPFPHRHA